MRAALGIEKLTLLPDEVTSEEIRSLHAANVSDQAIVDAIYICVGFNIIDGWPTLSASGFRLPGSSVVMQGGWRWLSHHERELAARQGPQSYEGKMAHLVESVLCGAGFLDPGIRQAASRATELPDPLGSYVKRVVECAYSDH